MLLGRKRTISVFHKTNSMKFTSTFAKNTWNYSHAVFRSRKRSSRKTNKYSWNCVQFTGRLIFLFILAFIFIHKCIFRIISALRRVRRVNNNKCAINHWKGNLRFLLLSIFGVVFKAPEHYIRQLAPAYMELK